MDALLAFPLDLPAEVTLALQNAGLTHRAVSPGRGAVRSATVTIGARHAGLVVALALVAPLLSHDLERGSQRALLAGTRVILDGDAPLRQKVPIALDLRTALADMKHWVILERRVTFHAGIERSLALRHRQP